MHIINDLNLDLTFQDYNSAKDLFLELCKNAAVGESNVGFFGNVGFPGISDIDALVIGTPEEIKRLNILFQREITNSETFKYLFWHPPVFVLNLIKDKIARLHTLEGLTGIMPNGSLLHKKEELKADELDLLNVIWFISLINVISDICRTIHNNEPVSLRLYLLVYKNLVHSFNNFSSSEDSLPVHHLQPSELRSLVKDSNHNLPTIFIKEQFFSLFTLTCQWFDEFCKKKIKIEPATPLNSFASSKTKIYKRAGRTFINVKSFYNMLNINSYAFQILVDYNSGGSTYKALEGYISAAKTCKEEYQKFKIPYPFIQPCSMPLSGSKRILLKTFNSTGIVNFL